MVEAIYLTLIPLGGCEVVKILRANLAPPLFFRNYTTYHRQIWYNYGSDRSYGLAEGSVLKYPEFPGKFRNKKCSGIFPECPETW